MTIRVSEGGVCAPKDFKAAGGTAGIKKSGLPDLALIVSEVPCTAAGVFTTNHAAAAPVLVSRERVSNGVARGVVVNSGCANACTGSRGIEDAVAMAAAAARAVGVHDKEMLVCSTGLIGMPLPMEKILPAIESVAKGLERDDLSAAEAIMTTDTRPKRAAVAHSDGWTVGGIAKGAAMIAPNMATMLAFVTTDASADAAVLQDSLRAATAESFNSISIDGDRSTNDSVLAFANGASSVTPKPGDLTEALTIVCRSLAEQIVADGEGATKLVRVRVRGAASNEQAAAAARGVAESLLVKTAIHGADPNWGRVAAAIGQTQVSVDWDRLSIALAGVPLLIEGSPAGGSEHERARAELQSNRDVSVLCDLYAGTGAAEMLTTDLSAEYVRLNSEYAT